MEALSVKEIADVVEGKLLQGDMNVLVESISTNSKEIREHEMFLPIIGERVDAHNFIEGAFDNGAVATFISHDVTLDNKYKDRVVIKVDDSIKALQRLAVWYRHKFQIPVIGITGSVGKTTTKEMIAAALETKYNVLKTAGNMNSQIGLPLTVLRITKEHEIAVIEMGMSEEGEMTKLARVAQPNMAVMTNIGVSHIGQLGSKENIRKEKMNIINQFKDTLSNNCLYVNGDDTLLAELIPYQSDMEQPEGNGVNVELTDETKKVFVNTKVLSYGIEVNCEYYAKDIESKDGKTTFTYVYPDGEEHIILNVLGIHNVMNAVAALSIAMKLGIAPATAKIGLEAYMPIAMRGQIMEKDGIKVIDDTYNASPDSMKSGLSTLFAMDGVKRRIAVFADVLELGESSYECHYSVGEHIVSMYNKGQKLDELVVIGTEAKAIAKAVEDSKIAIKVKRFDDNDSAITYLKENLQSGDIALVKGSRGMHLEKIVKALV